MEGLVAVLGAAAGQGRFGALQGESLAAVAAGDLADGSRLVLCTQPDGPQLAETAPMAEPADASAAAAQEFLGLAHPAVGVGDVILALGAAEEE